MSSKSRHSPVHLRSPYTVSETIAGLEGVVRSKGVTVLARIDHSGDAARVGLEVNPTELLIFGSPKAGTPLMVATPSVAIDLPLKALAWEDERGRVWLSFNTPEYLQQRHGFPADLLKNIAGASALIQKAVE